MRFLFDWFLPFQKKEKRMKAEKSALRKN